MLCPSIYNKAIYPSERDGRLVSPASSSPWPCASKLLSHDFQEKQIRGENDKKGRSTSVTAVTARPAHHHITSN